MLYMGSSKPFRSLADVQRHREFLHARRDGHMAGIRSHWSTLGEPAFRSGVVNGAVRSVWQAWSPMSTLKSVAGEPTELAGTVLGMALGSKAHTGWGRLLIWAASAATPVLLDRLQHNERVQHLLSELGRSWDRVKDHWRQRREDHSERSEPPE